MAEHAKVSINGTENDEKVEKNATDGEDIVNPWEVKAESMTGVDYDKIISKLDELSAIVEIFFNFSSIRFFTFN
jgi:hypothetical protein